jgi:hypothetical protein
MQRKRKNQETLSNRRGRGKQRQRWRQRGKERRAQGRE